MHLKFESNCQIAFHKGFISNPTDKYESLCVPIRPFRFFFSFLFIGISIRVYRQVDKQILKNNIRILLCIFFEILFENFNHKQSFPHEKKTLSSFSVFLFRIILQRNRLPILTTVLSIVILVNLDQPEHSSEGFVSWMEGKIRMLFFWK